MNGWKNCMANGKERESNFQIVIKKADIKSQNNPVDFNIQFADFDETLTLQLREKKENYWVLP